MFLTFTYESKTVFGEKEMEQAGAELCQAQPQAVLTGFPLASG